MAIARLFCSALSKARIIPKGLQINPKTLKLNTACADCISSGKRDLLQMGFTKSDAEILLRQPYSKNELMETVQIYDRADARAYFLDCIRGEAQEQIAVWGRPLDFSKKNKLVWDNDALNQDIMSITRKHRIEQNFKKGLLKCKELPEDVKMTPEDRATKTTLDKGFENIPGTQHEMMQYRGEVVLGSEPYVKNLLSLKKGEFFEMPGYAWTTDNMEYAFGNYADCDEDFMKLLNRISIKYHILCPENTKIMASRSRMGQEFVLPCDSKMKLVKKVVDDNKRFIEIFCEHIPNKSIDTVS